MADGPPEVAPLLALVGRGPGSQPPPAAPAAAAEAPRPAAPRARESLPGGVHGQLSGRELGDFAVGDLIGSGGMGEVYRARQRSVDRLVALKAMPRAALDDPARRQRFANEARAAALLDSPHVVRVHATHAHDGWLAIAMELVEGGSLDEALARHRAAGTGFAPAQAADLALQAARGLAAVHEQGLVHRDIKPGNLLLAADGTLKLGDFGLVKFLGEEALTLTGATLGTPLYMAPEQGRGLPPTPASDLYSLGCVLYELLTLRPPFAGDTPEALVFRHNFAEPELPAALAPQVPEALQAVCLKCLQKDPARRYPSAAELVEDLERLRAGQAPRTALFPPGRIGTGAAEALRRLGGRRRWPLALAAALALGLAGGWWWWDARKAETAQVRARLAPLARAEAAPATADGDLARLARLAGADDPQVRQGRARLAELERLRGALAALEPRVAEREARAAAAPLLDALALASGGADPRLAAWRARLEAVAQEEAALRAALAPLDAAPPTAPQREEAAPRLARLAVLAGGDDPDLARWRTACERAVALEAALRRRCARLDDPAPLAADALAELAEDRRRLAALVPGEALPAAWGARLEAGAARIAALRARLGEALAAAAGDDQATAAAEAAARELAALAALEPAEETRLAARQRARAERLAAEAAERTALAGRLAALDRAAPPPADAERDLARYRLLAGGADPAALRWHDRLAAVARERQRLAELAQRRAAPPATAADALAALAGDDEPLVAATRARAADADARRRACALRLDPAQEPPPGSAALLDRLAEVAPEDDAELARWRARVQRWQRAHAGLDPLDREVAIAPERLADGARLLAAAAADAPDAPAVARWRRRLDELAGPPAPPWAAGRGHDAHGPWIELEADGERQRLRWRPPMAFTLGSSEDEDGRRADEAPVAVRLTRGQWVADGECSQALWRAMAGGMPARSRDPRRPVEQVARTEAEEFCRRLGARLGGAQVRLPTEAEWEAAARAGAAGPWGAWTGEAAAAAIVHAGTGLDDPAPVNARAANALGLHDLLGNVWEWCAGGYGPPPAGAEAVDPAPPAGALAPARGGSWGDPLRRCRAAQRLALDPGLRSPYLGFRFVIDP